VQLSHETRPNSKAIAFLESQALVRREREEGRRERYLVDDSLGYKAVIASARSNAQLVEIARQGAGVLSAGIPVSTRLENIARFLDFVSEGITCAAEQACEVLYASAEATAGNGGRGASGIRSGYRGRARANPRCCHVLSVVTLPAVPGSLLPERVMGNQAVSRWMARGRRGCGAWNGGRRSCRGRAATGYC